MYIILLKFALPKLSKYRFAPEMSFSDEPLSIRGIALISSSVEDMFSVKQFLFSFQPRENGVPAFVSARQIDAVTSAIESDSRGERPFSEYLSQKTSVDF